MTLNTFTRLRLRPPLCSRSLLPVGAILFSLAVLPCRAANDPDFFHVAAPDTVHIEGWIGNKIDLCEKNRVFAQDRGVLLKPFVDKTDAKDGWRGEYWGKWVSSAVLDCEDKPDSALRAALDESLKRVIATQGSDGYIGTVPPSGRKLALWDVWCRTYVLLGLINDYDYTGDKAALDAACRSADSVITQFSSGNITITETGAPVILGLASSCILEPFALLYQRTGQKRYLDFSNEIVSEWNKPNRLTARGVRLEENAGTPLLNHAYSIMSCFEGLCELYRATGDRRHLDSAVKFAQAVRRTERMVVGSVSNQELFCNGADEQTEILEQPIETCATVTWTRLCLQILRLTGDPVWADEMEVTLYNALAGEMTPNGAWFSYYCPLQGERVPSHTQQQDTQLSCCVASGPRGLLLAPRWAVMTAKDGPVINLYAPGTASPTLADGSEVKLTQETDYPVSGLVKLRVDPAKPEDFTLRLRIPAWSQISSLQINGKKVDCLPGAYATLQRTWNPGDEIVLNLDMRGRIVAAPSGSPQLAIMRGPIVLAMDNRLVKGGNIAVHLLHGADGHVELNAVPSPIPGIWMTYEVPFEIKPSHFFDHYREKLVFCDFASAGNAWSPDDLYRVWLPQPLFMEQAFVSDTWKLMYPFPQYKSRPVVPAGAAKFN